MKTNKLFYKIMWPVAALLLGAIVLLAFYVPNAVRNNVLSSTESAAVKTTDQLRILRGYYSKNVIKDVLKVDGIKPGINHANDPATIPLPATMIHDLSTLISKDGTKVSLYSAFPFPNRKQRVLTPFEQEAWEFLSNNPKEKFAREESTEAGTVLRVAVADTMSAQVCVSCHNTHPDTPKQDWQLGDVRGVLEVTTNVDAALAAGSATAHRIIAVIAIVLGAVIATVYFVNRREIGGRLVQAANTIEACTQGRMAVGRKLPVTGDDEITQVAVGFNRFTERLTAMVKQVSDAVEQTTSVVTSTSSSAQETISAVLSQQAATDNVATAITQMSASAGSVADNAAAADQTAQEAGTAARSSSEIMAETVGEIQSLESEIDRACEVVTRLEVDSENIGAVLDVIRGIAEQTNLLALNAAIEAARAGEQGRGFAVVADEVRTLASRTQQSTEEIQQMIEQLQSGARDAVGTIQGGKEKVSLCVQNANRANDSMSSITEAVAGIGVLNSQIAGSASEQSAAAESISNSITSIGLTADRSAGGARQSAEQVERLRQVTEELRGVVAQFDLDSGTP